MPKGILTRKEVKLAPTRKAAHPLADVFAAQVTIELTPALKDGMAEQWDVDREVNRRIAMVERLAAETQRQSRKGRWHHSWLLAPAQV